LTGCVSCGFWRLLGLLRALHTFDEASNLRSALMVAGCVGAL
jgi:hypothetical protein